MLVNIKVTGGSNIESGQNDPKAGGGCNIDSGQNDPKATQGLKNKKNALVILDNTDSSWLLNNILMWIRIRSTILHPNVPIYFLHLMSDSDALHYLLTTRRHRVHVRR